MKLQVRQQLQEQQQEVSAALTPPTPQQVASQEADIASMVAEESARLASGGDPDVPDADSDAEDSPALAQVADDDEGDDDAPAETDDGEETPPEAAKAPSVDAEKLAKAVADRDLPALLEAMGPAADELLTSKAHASLRVAARDLSKKQKSAADAEAKAVSLAGALSAKYSDPVEVRKAIDTNDPGAVDKFLDYVEKTTGAEWNAILPWIAKNIAGRPERLAAKEQKVTTDTTAQDTQRKAKLEEAQAWVKVEVTKADAQLLVDIPEVVDMVIDEIRTGYSKGVTTPAKALPLVLKKLEAQHAKLTKLLARKGGKKPAKTVKPPSPAAKAGTRADNDSTRLSTLDEDIAWLKKEMGIK